MIFWGGLLCVFDVSFSQVTYINDEIASGFRFDFLNDFVGMLLITWGVLELAKFQIDDTYRKAMKFVFVCAALNSLEALSEHLVFNLPVLVSILLHVLSLVTLAAAVLFCTSMIQLSKAYLLSTSAGSWLKTRALVTFLWAVPFGILHLISIFALVTNSPIYLDIGLFVIPVWLLVAIPLVHLFISTNRMREESAFSQTPVPNLKPN